MKNKLWTSLFQPHILKRGYEYYDDGRIEDFKSEDNRLTATVFGTEDYQVEITLKNGFPENCSCTCPYASTGRPCKHLAAVLFYLENSPEYLKEVREKNEAMTNNLFDLANEQQIGDFLFKLLLNGEKLQNKFQQYLKTNGKKIDTTD
ncbi:SWIM zinc finger family protein [Lactovum odontotermitis]